MNDHDGIITRDILFSQIRIERGLLEETLSLLTHKQMLVPGVDGDWSVKDALAHISTWERWMICWTNSLLVGDKPDTPEQWDIDLMNSRTYQLVKELPLAKILEEFHLSYLDSLFLIHNLSDEQLFTVYPDTWPLGPLWTGIAANTIWHYKDHRIDITKWLETQEKGF
jgi:hypothetical protein